MSTVALSVLAAAGARFLGMVCRYSETRRHSQGNLVFNGIDMVLSVVINKALFDLTKTDKREPTDAEKLLLPTMGRYFVSIPISALITSLFYRNTDFIEDWRYGMVYSTFSFVAVDTVKYLTNDNTWAWFRP